MSDGMDLDKTRFVLDRIAEMHRTLCSLLDEGDMPTALTVAVAGIDAQISYVTTILKSIVDGLEEAA